MVPRLPGQGDALSESVAITGAGGYLGGLLVRHLVDHGHGDLRPLSRNDAPWLAVPPLAVDPDDLHALEKVFTGVDAVVHLAGANEAIARTDPDRAMTDTLVSARRVGEACAAVGVARVVYLSTVHVYGAALRPDATITEDVVPQPRSVYAISRLATEHLLAAAVADLVVLRLTNSVGAPTAPRVDRWSLVANDLARQLAVTGELRLHSDGRQWRDFVAVDDVCRVIAAALSPRAVPAGTYNLGSGRPQTVRQLAELVQAAAETQTGTRPALHVGPSEREPDAPYVVDTGRLRALGLAADTEIGDAIAETVRFCLDHRADLREDEE